MSNWEVKDSSGFRVVPDVMCVMRDGVALSNDLYLPVGDGPFSTVLCRTPYDNQMPYYVDWACRFAVAGFAAVVQDCRGRYDSDGVWEPYVTDGRDGSDTIGWLGAQSWCNGRVGTFGFSYVGFNQLLAAVEQPPGLQALVPIGNQEDNYGHIWCDGVLQLEAAANFFRLGRRTMQERAAEYVDTTEIYNAIPLERALDPVGGSEYFEAFLSHPTFDDYWRSYSLKDRYPKILAPALFVTGWYDNLVHEQFKCFRGIRENAATTEARELTKIIVGPWTHYDIGAREIAGVDFGESAELDVPALHIDWYKAHLGPGSQKTDGQAPLELFVMGRNEWIVASSWPVEGTEFVNLFLRHSDELTDNATGRLSVDPPDEEEVDEFPYDPRSPVPTVGGASQFDGGPRDRRGLHSRPDVLLYASDPLGAAVDVVGPVEAILWASTTADDTDFAATLVDIHPDGRATAICEGISRARFRHGFDREIALTPGEVFEIKLSLWETGMRFNAGHRIGLEITSSNFPRFNRSLNTMQPIGSGTRVVVAQQSIYHAPAHPSRLVLPIISGTVAP